VKDMRIALPLLWVFMLVNYLYCDVISLFDPSVLRAVVGAGPSGGTVVMTPEMLFASGVLMEIPMAMILLSRVLPYRVDRWTNVVAAAFMVLVQFGSLFVGAPAAYYLFFTAIEVGTLVVIAALALRWSDAARVNAMPANATKANAAPAVAG
jgi:hypothetical protein